MEWVSNPVPVDKKQGEIHICTDLSELNRACPKDNFPTPFIDQILDECAGSEVFSFMDGFSVYNQIQKLLKAIFVYPISLTEWVSNPVPVDKKQGAIHIFTDFHDLNRACLKDNFPTPFIDHILDECAGSEVFSLMDGFSGYNQIQIKPKDQHKTTFICPWDTFSY